MLYIMLYIAGMDVHVCMCVYISSCADEGACDILIGNWYSYMYMHRQTLIVS